MRLVHNKPRKELNQVGSKAISILPHEGMILKHNIWNRFFAMTKRKKSIKYISIDPIKAKSLGPFQGLSTLPFGFTILFPPLCRLNICFLFLRQHRPQV